MTVQHLTTSVVNIVTEVCGIVGSEVRSDRPLIEYGLDSVRAIDMLVSLEESFGVNIPEEKAYYLRTVDDVVLYLQESLES